jgi:hypothetical protein
VFLLSGNDDDGQRISAHFKTGRLDFGTTHLKRVPSLYLNNQDQVTVNAFVENVSTGKYASAFEGRRVKMARGPNGRFWAFKIANVGRSKIDIRSLEFYLNILNRKIR